MAPEFNFIIQPEDNPLVENVKNRAAANRQALSDRQQNAALEQNIRTKAEATKAVSQKGAIRPQRTAALEELTAYRREGLKVLNLYMGNGPAHVNHEARLPWEILNDGYNTRFRNPGPSDNITYEKIRSDYADAMNVVMTELANVYGNKTTNVYLHIIGSQYTSPSLITFPWDYQPDFLLYGLNFGPMSVTDAVPEAIGDRSNVQKITMRADVTDVVGHLRSNGVNIEEYDCIFIESTYVQPRPFMSGGRFTIDDPYVVDYFTVRPPQILYSYTTLSLLTPVIFDANEDPVEGSAPLLNLLTQLDGPNTYGFSGQTDLSGSLSNIMPNSVLREYTTENVQDTMRQIRKPGKRLISIFYRGGFSLFSGPGSAPRLYFSVDRATTPTGGGGINNIPTWDQTLPLNKVYTMSIPFFDSLLSRLLYPLKRVVDILTPAQYESGVVYEDPYVVIPVETRERPAELYLALRYAYVIYLANTIAQQYTGTSTFLQTTTQTLAVEVKLAPTWRDHYFDYGLDESFDAAYWHPYVVVEVSSAMRALYSAAMTRKDLKRT